MESNYADSVVQEAGVKPKEPLKEKKAAASGHPTKKYIGGAPVGTLLKVKGKAKTKGLGAGAAEPAPTPAPSPAPAPAPTPAPAEAKAEPAKEGAKKEGAKKEGEKKEGEKKEGEEETKVTLESNIEIRNLWAFLGIISFLLVFTVLFEITKEYLVEYVHASPNAPIIAAIFSELTVLGFLALVTFLLGKFGLDHLSLIVYGHKDVAEDKAKLGEILEKIHIIIFMVMVIFICEALGMLYFARSCAREWSREQSRVLRKSKRQQLVKKFEDIKNDNMPSCFELAFLWWCGRAKEYYEIQRQVQFMLVRQEFIFDETTYNKNLENPEGIELDRDFSFSLYLKKLMGQRLAEIVELPIFQWIFLELIIAALIVSTIAFTGSWQYLIWLWIGLSWFFLLLCVLMRRKLLHIFYLLANDKDGAPLLKEPCTPSPGQLTPRGEYKPCGTFQPRGGNATMMFGRPVDFTSQAPTTPPTAKPVQSQMQTANPNDETILEVKDDNTGAHAGDASTSAAGSGEGAGTGSGAGDGPPAEQASELTPLKSEEGKGKPKKTPRDTWKKLKKPTALDENFDGKVDREEWFNRYKTMNGFDLYDLDGNGIIDTEEFCEAKEFGHLHRAHYPPEIRETQPRYLEFDDLEPAGWCVPSCLKGKPGKEGSAQAKMFNLFWFGRNEVHFHLFMIRFIFLGMSVQSAVFALQIIPSYIAQVYEPWWAVAISALNFIPVFLIYFVYVFELIKMSVIVTSIEQKRDRRMVETVIRHQKEARALMMLRLVVAMNGEPLKEGEKPTPAEMFEIMNDDENSFLIEKMNKIFEKIDKDGSGTLTHDEIEGIFSTFGLPVNPEKIDSMMENMNIDDDDTSNGKGGPVVTRFEFFTWLMAKERQAKNMGTEQFVHEIFKILDVEGEVDVETGEMLGGDNELSVSEFQQGLQRIGMGGEMFNFAEVSAIFLELDKEGTNSLHPEEMERWVEIHEAENLSKAGDDSGTWYSCGWW